MLEKIEEQINKGKLLNLEPKMIILGSKFFNYLHKSQMGFTPFHKSSQIQRLFDCQLLEDDINKEKIEVLFTLEKEENGI